MGIPASGNIFSRSNQEIKVNIDQRFQQAVALIGSGDVPALDRLLTDHPELAKGSAAWVKKLRAESEQRGVSTGAAPRARRSKSARSKPTQSKSAQSGHDK